MWRQPPRLSRQDEARRNPAQTFLNTASKPTEFASRASYSP
jgi:hypothetical protein